MFDSLKGMAGLAGIMKDLPRIKAKMEEVKERLDRETVEAETGGGAVRAIANGQLRVINVRIDPTLMSGLVDAGDEADRVMAEDLISGAVNAALEKARDLAQREMMAAAEELDLPIPGGMVSGLLN